MLLILTDYYILFKLISLIKDFFLLPYLLPVLRFFKMLIKMCILIFSLLRYSNYFLKIAVDNIEKNKRENFNNISGDSSKESGYCKNCNQYFKKLSQHYSKCKEKNS